MDTMDTMTELLASSLTMQIKAISSMLKQEQRINFIGLLKKSDIIIILNDAKSSIDIYSSQEAEAITKRIDHAIASLEKIPFQSMTRGACFMVNALINEINVFIRSLSKESQ